MLAELTQSEIEEVLANNYIGRIGCKDDESVYIVPVNYQYKPGYVQCYSLVGEKIQMMRKHPDVCFEVEEIKDNSHWTTIICWGRYEEITDESELELLRPQYAEYMLRMRASLSSLPPNEHAGIQPTEAELSAPVIYRIRFTKYSGRFEKAL
jgi:nitroimidazol reductase NimA-like FMN-containing flavoprotein (pyridoxamine 5'-phosphate oxidase superfamily)